MFHNLSIRKVHILFVTHGLTDGFVNCPLIPKLYIILKSASNHTTRQQLNVAIANHIQKLVNINKRITKHFLVDFKTKYWYNTKNGREYMESNKKVDISLTLLIFIA